MGTLMSEITSVNQLITLGGTEVGAYFAYPVGAMAAFWAGRRLLGIARGFFGG